MLNMFRVGDLRKRILFTLLMILLYRIGAFVPAPGIDVEQVQLLRDRANQGGVLAFLQLFSGGSLTSFAVFALGVMPYITASIIMQVLGVVVPRIEQWQQQGAVGQRKITQWTRYMTVIIRSFNLLVLPFCSMTVAMQLAVPLVQIFYPIFILER